MLGDTGCCFGIKLIDRGIVRNHQPHRNIPVARLGQASCRMGPFIRFVQVNRSKPSYLARTK
jgi:hypothetical protein